MFKLKVSETFSIDQSLCDELTLNFFDKPSNKGIESLPKTLIFESQYLCNPM